MARLLRLSSLKPRSQCVIKDTRNCCTPIWATGRYTLTQCDISYIILEMFFSGTILIDDGVCYSHNQCLHGTPLNNYCRVSSSGGLSLATNFSLSTQSLNRVQALLCQAISILTASVDTVRHQPRNNSQHSLRPPTSSAFVNTNTNI